MSCDFLQRVLNEVNLPCSPKAVLSALALCADAQGGEASPAMGELERLTGLGVRSIRQILRRATAQGWITIVRPGGGRGKTTAYRINPDKLPKHLPAAASGEDRGLG